MVTIVTKSRNSNFKIITFRLNEKTMSIHKYSEVNFEVENCLQSSTAIFLITLSFKCSSIS